LLYGLVIGSSSAGSHTSVNKWFLPAQRCHNHRWVSDSFQSNPSVS